MECFTAKHAAKITGALTCFDRLIFKGYLPISNCASMDALFYRNHWLVKDFRTIAPKVSQTLGAHARAMAKRANRPFSIEWGRVDKEALARNLAAKDRITSGLVCVFQVIEPCATFRIIPGAQRPRFTHARRKRNFFCFYFMDREFGLIHVRVQAWFPFPVQIYINGHEWLARKLDRHKIAYTKIDNAFTSIADPVKAQRFADHMARKRLPAILEILARRCNPLLGSLLKGMSHYWVCDQAEIALDVMFRDRAALRHLYPSLLRHATLELGAEDVLRFLGKKLHGNFNSEILSDFKVRVCGARIKHRLKGNWIKLYDKSGCVLRCEIVINQPREFFVLRQGRRKSRSCLGWFPMAKRVSNLHRFFDVGRAIARRHLDALALVEDPSLAFADLNRLASPTSRGKLHARALNPLNPDDARLAAAVLRGEFCIKGFQNRDIRTILFPNTPRSGPKATAAARRVTYLCRILKAHQLISRIPRSRRYLLSPAGRRLLAAAVFLRQDELPRKLTG